MSYVGNSATTQSFSSGTDYFSGNGSSTAFTLTRPVVSVNDIEVVVNNVPQDPSSAYTVSGNTITFTGAPSSGTNNIYVRYLSTVTQVMQPAAGSVGTAQLSATGASSTKYLRGDNTWSGVAPVIVSDQVNTSTGYFSLPAGTTAQRPASSVAGQQRWNTDTSQMEFYNGTAWTSVWAFTYTIEYIMVAGGGGGGAGHAGGGGAGGVLTGSITAVSPGTAYPIVIGGGGNASTYGSADPTNGSNTTFNSLTAIGGGFGGGNNQTTKAGQSGGSGGGGSNAVSGTQSGGSGTSGQGFAGGTGSGGGSWAAAGGGGATAAGQNNVSTAVGGNGGAGTNWQSLGTYYGGGGGGGGGDNPNSPVAGSGGAGGGGAGTIGGAGNATAGTANRGGGGGGSRDANGGAGGSGIVIVRYLGGTRGTGGTITSAGGYTYHTFTSSGTYTS